MIYALPPQSPDALYCTLYFAYLSLPKWRSIRFLVTCAELHLPVGASNSADSTVTGLTVYLTMLPVD